MAANDELPPLPSITPQKIKRLIVLLASTNAMPEARDFRTKFEESKKIAHQYDKMRNFHGEFRGVFTPYIMSIEYLLHDPRVKKVHAAYYPYLSDAKRLEDACAALFIETDVMNDLDKGRLFAPEVQKKIETIAQEQQTPQTEKKIEEVIKEALEKKKVEKKKIDFGGSYKPVEEKKEEVKPEAQKIVIPPSTLVLPPAKPSNTWIFRAKLAASKFAPLKKIGKVISHQGKMLYTKHPVTAKYAISSAIGGIASTVMGWPGMPVTGFIAGIAAPYFAKKAFEIISPPPRPEPEEEEYEYEEPTYAQGAARPGGFSMPQDSGGQGYSQGAARPGGFSSSFNPGVAQGAARPSRTMGNSFKNLQRAAGAARNLRSAVTAVRGFAILLNPYIGIPVLIILLFFLIFVILPVDSLFPPGQPTLTSSPVGTTSQVKLIKSGPSAVNNGEKIVYTITVRNEGTSPASADVSDAIPVGTKYVESSPGAKIENNTAKWSLPSIPAGQSQTISLTVQPEKNDFWAINEAIAKVLSFGFSSGGGPISVAEGEQDKLVAETIKGQQRNVQILGDEESFVQTVMRNGASQGMGAKEQFLRQTYQASAKNNLNPLILLATWGTETGFKVELSAKAFSCPVGVSSDFSRQADCGAKTYTYWMDIFDKKNVDGKLGIDEVTDHAGTQKTGKVCMYFDSLLYSMEWYGPLCHFKDDNINYRPNLVQFYKLFGGFN